MNTQLIFSSKTDMWSTPQAFFDKYNEKYLFDLDVCATVENAKCSHFLTEGMNGLHQGWAKMNWCNPPYGRGITGLWVEKAFSESLRGNTTVMLLPARTDTKWFHQFIYQKEGVECEFIKGRLKFGGCKDSAPFPSMVVIFNGKK